MSHKDAFKKVKRATVALAIMNSANPRQPFEIIGTGFCVDAAGIIVSCAHVIEAFMAKSIQEQIEQGKADERNRGKERHVIGPIAAIRPHVLFFVTEGISEELVVFPTPVEFCMAKTDRDIGLVRVHKHKYFAGGFPCLTIAEYTEINEGDEVGICGFPLGTHLKKELGTVSSSFTKGIISSVIPSAGVPLQYLKGFQLDATATHGNSGGPVFLLESGEVIGVLSQGVRNPQGDVVPGILKAEPIYGVLDSIPRLKAANQDEFARLVDDFQKGQA
jgi:S1-C subfamily serine protease